MAVVLMLCLLAAFGGLWLFLALLWGALRIGFWLVGAVLGLIVGGAALLAAVVVALALLPVAGLLMLPLALPLLLLLALVWWLARPSRRPQALATQ